MSDRDQRFNQGEQSVPQPAAPSGTPQHDGYVIDTPSIVLPLDHQRTEDMPQKNKLHLLSGFCEYPDGVTFHDQEPDETILLFLRKSQFVNLPWIISSVIALFLPLFFFVISPLLLPFSIPVGTAIILFLLYYLLVITYAFVNFVIWYYNAALITNKRIVNIDFHQLVFKEIAETKLGLVQDVSYHQQSVFESLFDYGHILIQTAGTIDNFEFNDLPKPERIEEIVNSLIGRGRLYVP